MIRGWKIGETITILASKSLDILESKWYDEAMEDNKKRKTRTPINYSYKIETEDEFPYSITENSENTLAEQLKFLCLPAFKVYGNGILMAYGCGEEIKYSSVRWKKKFETGRKRQIYEILFLNGDIEFYTARQFEARFKDVTVKVGVAGDESELKNVYCIAEIKATKEFKNRKTKNS